MEKSHKYTVLKQDSNKRVDIFLYETNDFVSRSQIKKLIEKNAVTVDGKAVKSSFKLKQGCKVDVFSLETVEIKIIKEDIPLEIIYEDKCIVIVNKPAPMVVHPAPGHYTGTLVNALMSKIEDLKPICGELRPGIVHRLDMETSGVMVVAKNQNSLTSLSAQFKNREVKKEYLAICAGSPITAEFFSDKKVGRSDKDGKKMSAKSSDGRDAYTKFILEKKLNGISLIRAFPKTGRTHQIRVHLSSLGLPLIGDKLYLKPKHLAKIKNKEKYEVLKNFGRHALHAEKIEFTHPQTGARVSFSAKIPKDLTDLLGKFDE